MARYAEDFAGMPAGFRDPTGVDPNYRGGYGGMRMRGGGGRAPYGAHRREHPYDLEMWGGYGGIHRGEPPRRARYDRDMREMGGVRPYRDAHFLHEYNANSPVLARERYDRDNRGGRDARWPEQPWEREMRYRRGYSNRGMSDAGFGEHWTRYPGHPGR